MLLAIDIGNTTINCGLFNPLQEIPGLKPGDERGFVQKGREPRPSGRGGSTESRIIERFFIPAKDYSLPEMKKKIGKFGIDDIIICSVVPAATKIIDKDLRRLLARQPYIIGKDIKAPIRNLYRRPAQVGQDRLVNACAGAALYGWPLVVVDFGTAITFDAISRDKEYLGGMILPGLDISLEALAQRTALLPEVKLARPEEFIGRDTQSSMLSGIIYGFAGLTDNLALKIKDKIGRDAQVIGTGGNINLIGRYCRQLDKLDRDLTLKGLRLIYGKGSFVK